MEIKNFASSFYIGNTTRGIQSAVFFDASFASFNNQSPVSLITGSPGSGKTFLAQTLCAQSSAAGKMTVVIDPKADFLSMKEIEKDLGVVNVIPLSPKSKRGIIDPFVICGDDKALGITLAKELLITFTGRNRQDLPLEVIDPILADIAEKDNACFGMLKDELRRYNGSDRKQSEGVRNIGMALQAMSNVPFAKLAFADPYKVPKRASIKEGLTVITLLGLNLPSSETKREDYTTDDLLASGLMFLVSNYVHRVLGEDTNRQRPKMLFIDEAWAIIQNQAGAKIVHDVAQLGRSLGMSLVLITQNAGHLKNINIENAITTFFSFRTNGREGNNIAEMMGLRDSNDDRAIDFTDLMTDLKNGECLMKDVRKRYSTVQISRYKQDWAEAFESNPIDKYKNKQNTKTQKDMKSGV